MRSMVALAIERRTEAVRLARMIEKPCLRCAYIDGRTCNHPAFLNLSADPVTGRFSAKSFTDVRKARMGLCRGNLFERREFSVKRWLKAHPGARLLAIMLVLSLLAAQIASKYQPL